MVEKEAVHLVVENPVNRWRSVRVPVPSDPISVEEIPRFVKKVGPFYDNGLDRMGHPLIKKCIGFLMPSILGIFNCCL